MKILKCEVCNNLELFDVLDLGLHPMCDDLVSVGSDRVCKEYPIVIAYCKNCNTAHQRFQIPKEELFTDSYSYRARFTADVLNGMKDLVSDFIGRFNVLDGKKVIDIGCNDGSLLDFFREFGAKTYGVEPTGAASDASAKGHVVVNDYLTPQVSSDFVKQHGKLDVITFTNVFAHIEDLQSLLSSLRILMHDDSVIVIENHYLGSILEKMQFDTFYHEHPRTYSFTSFVFIAKALGVEILDVKFPARYGGNIRVTMGRKASYDMEYDNALLIQQESRFFSEFSRMSDFINFWKIDMKHKLKLHVDRFGPLSAKAFPARAAILVKLLEIDVDIISKVFEKPGSLKIGKFVPGTRIPIVSDDELLSNFADHEVLVNFAWHISSEIEKYLLNSGFKGSVLNIL